MKKMRKIFAVLLTLAMVLAMSMTAFAEDVDTQMGSTGSLTVTGLVPGESTTVEIYRVVELDADHSTWKRGKGVAESDVDFSKKPVEINWANFVDKKATLEKVGEITTTDDSVKFKNLAEGAYYVYAGSRETSYNPMGEAVYEYGNDGLMKPADKTITAKGEKYTLTKTFTDANGETEYKVVERGQTIGFTITAVFPSYDKDAKDRAFQITDEPKGMKITNVTVKVGNDELSAGNDTYSLVGVNDDEDKTDKTNPALTLPTTDKVRVRFSSDYIGTANAHAGQTVTVNVTAQITDADTFSNTASSDKGSSTPNVNGKLGSITINKYDENYGKDNVESKLLAGAEFSIAPATDKNAKIEFVYVGKEGDVSVYKKATADDTEVKVTNIVAEDGKVIAKGLDDGEYAIVEEKAPKGYSVVPVDNATIVNGTNPTVEVNVSDTQLHTLPHTGGIGTTIFTIAGCLIMVTAAGLFFASRKKANK